MIRKSAMRRIVPLLYTSICSIFSQEEVVDYRGVSSFSEVLLYENVPCRISYVSHIPSKAWGKSGVELAHETTQKVKLFIDPSIAVPVGAVVEISGKQYQYGGAAAVYYGHQEIVLQEIVDC